MVSTIIALDYQQAVLKDKTISRHENVYYQYAYNSHYELEIHNKSHYVKHPWTFIMNEEFDVL